MSRLWRTDGRTHGKWKVGQYSVWAESASISSYLGEPPLLFLRKQVASWSSSFDVTLARLVPSLIPAIIHAAHQISPPTLSLEASMSWSSNCSKLINHQNDQNSDQTRQSKQCGFSIYTFDNLKSKSMIRLVREEKMVLSGLVFARKIARMILNQNI